MGLNFSLNGLFHIGLDVFSSKVFWLRPFFWDREYEFGEAIPKCIDEKNSCRLSSFWERIEEQVQLNNERFKLSIDFEADCLAGNYIRDMLCYWTFGIEIAIVVVAALVLLGSFVHRRKQLQLEPDIPSP